MLIAWASLASINKIRRNSQKPNLISVIFKPTPDGQDWVLNLVVEAHEAFNSTIVNNLTNYGVEHKKRRIKNQVKPKIAEIEVTKDSTKMMDISQMIDNMQVCEQ